MTHSSFRRRQQTITQQRKQTFSNSLGCFRNYFLVGFCKEFMWKMTYMHFISLYIFYCHKLQQWGWVTSSRNICYDPPPTYTDQSKHVNMATNIYSTIQNHKEQIGERSGSVVECLTRDRRAAGSSLTGVTALWSFEQDTFILA